MYKKESTLGLVGSILGIVAIVFILVFRVIFGGAGAIVGSQYMSEYGNELSDFSDEFNAEFGDDFGEFDDAYQLYLDDYDALVVAEAVRKIVTGIIAILLLIAGVILGFIGKGKLQREDKTGGILLIVSGGLAAIAMFMAGWAFAFVTAMAALCLTGGIMVVAKRTSPAPIAPPTPPENPAQ